jgi:hypothetical protein
MKLLLSLFFTMGLSNVAIAQNLDAKKTIHQYTELNLSLGYNDGSTISLKLQEQRGPYDIKTYKIYKDENDELTAKRPAIEKELLKMNAFFERFIGKGDCMDILIELKTASRGLGMIKGMHSISSTNEESQSQSAAQKSLEGLFGDLKFKANTTCKASIEGELAEVLK